MPVEWEADSESAKSSDRHVFQEPAPGPEIAGRRRLAVLAGYTNDKPTAQSLLLDTEPLVRVAALGALERLGVLEKSQLIECLEDDKPSVRLRALEVLGGATGHLLGDLAATELPRLLADPEPSVVEVACWAAGEHPDKAEELVHSVVSVALHHDDPLCREAAVASLGALGHEDGRLAVLAGLKEKAAIRRRAVLALAAFEGPDIELALASALGDRDWQVKQAAEDLLGVEPGPDS